MIYSRCAVIKLAIEYSNSNYFEYDVIIRVRFDTNNIVEYYISN